MPLALLVARRLVLATAASAVAAAVGNRVMHRLWDLERAARPVEDDAGEGAGAEPADGDTDDGAPEPVEPRTR